MRKIIPPWDFGSLRLEAVLADTPELQDLCFRLRYFTFCEPQHPGDKVRFRPEDNPGERETDEYDQYSYHILINAVENGVSRPVGTFRLIRCEEGFFMEHENFSGTPFEMPAEHLGVPVLPEKTLEAGRWSGHALDLPGRTDKALISMMLAKSALALSKQLGRTQWICGIDHISATRLRMLGWPLDRLIPGVHDYYGDEAEVCIIPLGNYDMPCARTTTSPAPARFLKPTGTNDRK